jgi:hypothetical protein
MTDVMKLVNELKVALDRIPGLDLSDILLDKCKD